MSLPTTYGTDHKWALYDVASFLTLNSDDLSTKLNIDVLVQNETGANITNRVDDFQTDVSLTGVLKIGATIPTVGQTITYGGVSYIIKSVDDSGTNNAYRKVTVKGTKYQYITTT